MKKYGHVIALSLMFLGIVFGIYCGVWLGLVGGIASVVDGCNVQPIDGMKIGSGVARVLLSGPTGFACGGLLFFAGVAVEKA